MVTQLQQSFLLQCMMLRWMFLQQTIGALMSIHISTQDITGQQTITLQLVSSRFYDEGWNTYVYPSYYVLSVHQQFRILFLWIWLWRIWYIWNGRMDMVSKSAVSDELSLKSGSMVAEKESAGELKKETDGKETEEMEMSYKVLYPVQLLNNHSRELLLEKI